MTNASGAPQEVSCYLIGTGAQVGRCQQCGQPVTPCPGGHADVANARVQLGGPQQDLLLIVAPLHAPLCQGKVRPATKMPPEPKGGNNRIRRLGS